MDNPFIEIEISTDDPLELSVCKSYWDLTRNMKFVYAVRDLSTKFNMPMIRITDIAVQNATVTVKCISCGDNVKKYTMRRDFHADDITKPEFFKCQKCLTELENRKQVFETQRLLTASENIVKIDKEKKYEKMHVAFANRAWDQLTQIELEILIIIAESDNRKEIYEKVFYNLEIGSDLRNNKWERLNAIEKLDLIWMERYDDNKIMHFHILDQLRRQLKFLYPELFLNN